MLNPNQTGALNSKAPGGALHFFLISPLQTLCFHHSEVLTKPTPLYSKSHYSTLVHQQPNKTGVTLRTIGTNNEAEPSWTEPSKTEESYSLKSVATEEEMNLRVTKPNHIEPSVLQQQSQMHRAT